MNGEGAAVLQGNPRIYLSEAIDAIRDKLLAHRLSKKFSLWTTILAQIRKQDAFDGKLADTILEIINDFLEGLDEEAINALWEQTDTGMQSEYGAEELHPDEVRQDLSMELLDEVTRLAWEEAKRKGR